MSKEARNSSLLFLALLLGPLSLSLFAQAPSGPIITINEALGPERAQLKRADERLREEEIASALDLLILLANDQGDKLIPLHEAAEPYAFTTYCTLREAILRRLLPNPAARKEILRRGGLQTRGEIAPPGNWNWTLFQEDAPNAWLARADELTRLGQWNDARDRLCRLSPSLRETDSNVWLSLPSEISLEPELLARLAYISLLEGSPRRAKAEREILAARHPAARGRIWGRDENLLQQVDAWLAENARQPPRNASASSTHLPFAISPATKLLYRRDLPSEASSRPESPAPSPLFPAFFANKIYLSTADALFSWPLNEPLAPTGPFPAPLNRVAIKPDPESAPIDAIRPFLTVSEGCIYARLGAEVTRKRTAVLAGDDAPAVIAAFDASRGDHLLPGFPLSPGLDEQFDGPPLVSGEKCFVAIRRRDGARTELLLRCIDIASTKTLWQKSICGAETRGRGLRDEASQTVLLQDGERLYAVSHLGCVACLDAASGNLRWLTKYARSEFPSADALPPPRWRRGLGSALLHGDQLIVLAADCPRVFALDALSGELRWASRPEAMTDACYILGATEEEILLQGESLYWLDARTGAVKTAFPPRVAATGHSQTGPYVAAGRGLWAGDTIYYPTSSAIIGVKRSTAGSKLDVTPIITLPESKQSDGNLAWHAGVLYWSSRNTLLAWHAPLKTNE